MGGGKVCDIILTILEQAIDFVYCSMVLSKQPRSLHLVALAVRVHNAAILIWFVDYAALAEKNDAVHT